MDLDDPNASDVLFRFEEGPIGEHRLFNPVADHDGRVGRRGRNRNGHAARLEIACYRRRATLPIDLLPIDHWCCGLVRGRAPDPYRYETWFDVQDVTLTGRANGFLKSARRHEVLWNYGPPIPACYAALVQPESPAVLALKKLVHQTLAAQRAETHLSFVGLTAAAEDLTQILRALYFTLCRDFGTLFHDVETFTLHRPSQRIRLWDELLPKRGSPLHRTTCIDFVTLSAAVPESMGKRPLLFEIGMSSTAHAVLGVANPSKCFGRPVFYAQDRGLLHRAMERGALLVLDVTAFALGQSFERALEAGKTYLDRESSTDGDPPFLYAVDIH